MNNKNQTTKTNQSWGRWNDKSKQGTTSNAKTNPTPNSAFSTTSKTGQSSWSTTAGKTTSFNSKLGKSYGVGQSQAREPVVTPVCTIGLQIQPCDVNLEINNMEGDHPPTWDFKVFHICQMEIFNKFTLDEIRYYDYLHGEYIDKAKQEFAKTTTKFGRAGTGGTTTPQFGQNRNVETIQKHITPWRRPAEAINDPPLATQKQPFGTLPASTITPPQAEVDEAPPKQDQIPDDPGFRDNISLYEHIMTVNPSDSATPGLHQLNPQKIQINLAPKDIMLKSKQGNFKRFDQNQRNLDDEKKITDNLEYSYIPDLDTIKNNDEVYNFKVTHRNFGSISFPKGFKVKKINPEKNISFSDRKVNVNLPNTLKKSLGIDKDFISIVTIKNILPSEDRSQESLREYETDLMKFCNDHDLSFISYTYEDGTLMFSVPSLSLFPIEIE